MGKFILAISLLFLQVRQDTPEEGKPKSCDNFKQTPESHRCECDKALQKCNGGIPQPSPNVEYDTKCKTYCRKQNCQCIGHGCAS